MGWKSRGTASLRFPGEAISLMLYNSEAILEHKSIGRACKIQRGQGMHHHRQCKIVITLLQVSMTQTRRLGTRACRSVSSNQGQCLPTIGGLVSDSPNSSWLPCTCPLTSDPYLSLSHPHCHSYTSPCTLWAHQSSIQPSSDPASPHSHQVRRWVPSRPRNHVGPLSRVA